MINSSKLVQTSSCARREWYLQHLHGSKNKFSTKKRKVYIQSVLTSIFHEYPKFQYDFNPICTRFFTIDDISKFQNFSKHTMCRTNCLHLFHSLFYSMTNVNLVQFSWHQRVKTMFSKQDEVFNKNIHIRFAEKLE